MLKYTKRLFLYIVSMRLISHILKLKLPVFVFKVPNYSSSTLHFWIWTVTWVRKPLYAYYLCLKRPLHIRLRIQPLLVAPCLAIKLQLPSLKCSLFLIMHRIPVLSMNKTEMSWTSLRGITIRRGKFALKPLLRNTQEKWHLWVKYSIMFLSTYIYGMTARLF